MTRPAPRPWHSQTALEDFAMVTYDVPPERLVRQLPPSIRPLEFTIDGTSRALVSAVIFRDRDFHFRLAPWARMNCGQVNYRAYVERGDETGVWFFGTSLDHRLVQVARTLWSMPWHREPLQIKARWDEPKPTASPMASPTPERTGSLADYQFRGLGEWGRAELHITGPTEEIDLLPGFATEIQQRQVLLDPFAGWYRRSRDGRVGRYGVWHRPLMPQRARIEHASFDVFERAGLVTAGQAPLHAVVQRETTFDVLTPPHRLF